MRRWSPYNYAYDNPIRFIGPDGMKPSPSEAARIAKHAYGNNDVTLKGGWKVSEREFKGVTLSDKKTGLQSQVYERTIQKGKDKGKVEYVYATAGTNPKEMRPAMGREYPCLGCTSLLRSKNLSARRVN